MPQFDTFSFFSQLFWVFVSFSFFYVSLAYYIIPSIAVILKVREHCKGLTNQVIVDGFSTYYHYPLALPGVSSLAQSHYPALVHRFIVGKLTRNFFGLMLIELNSWLFLKLAILMSFVLFRFY